MLDLCPLKITSVSQTLAYFITCFSFLVFFHTISIHTKFSIYLELDTEIAVRPVTMWLVVGDLDVAFLSPEDRKNHKKDLEFDLNMVRSALMYLRSAHASRGLRLGIVYNPDSDKKKLIPREAWLTRALYLIGHAVRLPGSTENPVKYADQMAARNFGIRLLTGALDALNVSAKYTTMESMLVSVSLLLYL